MVLGATYSNPEAYTKYLKNLQEQRLNSRKWDSAWDNLLAPVKTQLAQLQRSRAKWGARSYAPLYESYIELLMKVRTKITTAAQSAKLHGRTFREEVDARKITDYRGTRWSAWVPIKVREAFKVEFDKARLENPRVRMVVPFETPTERSANEKRWLKLEGIIANERIKYANHSYPLQLLNHAYDKARARTITTHAPVLWIHLLSKEQQEYFNQWKKDTMDGLRDRAED
jgi:hypothetical protein